MDIGSKVGMKQIDAGINDCYSDARSIRSGYRQADTLDAFGYDLSRYRGCSHCYRIFADAIRLLECVDRMIRRDAQNRRVAKIGRASCREGEGTEEGGEYR